MAPVSRLKQLVSARKPISISARTATIFCCHRLMVVALVPEPLMTEAALDNISLVGNIMIFCVGINLLFPKTLRVANMLPGLVIAAAFACF